MFTVDQTEVSSYRVASLRDQARHDAEARQVAPFNARTWAHRARSAVARRSS